MNAEYRAEKEASVSFLGGGGIWEINYVTVIAPVAAFLWALLQTRQGFFKPYTIPALFTDFLLHCGAILFATTIYGGAPQALLGLLLLPAIAVVLQPKVETTRSTPKSRLEAYMEGKPKDSDEPVPKPDLDPLPIKPYITTYRGAMMIITCTSILAVDFKVFPRRFAKTESFGTSLMDLGVGSFVFAAGLVAARPQLKAQRDGRPSFVGSVTTALRHSLPLVVLGLVRLWSVKGLDYVEHVSEYGVHWNFFFTLALLGPVTAILQPILYWMPAYGLLTFFIGCVYECVLYFTPDLKSYIILSARVPGDWISQNREGLFSFIGYFAIFIAGQGTGLTILRRESHSGELEDDNRDPLDEDDEWLADVLGSSDRSDITAGDQDKKSPAPTKPKKKEKHPDPLGLIWVAQSYDDSVFLAKWTIIWFILCVWAMWHYGPHLFVSRRMASLAYILWVCAFNTTQLLLFNLVERVMFPNVHQGKDMPTERQRVKDATSWVMKAFNRNGLALFLLANLLTGIINLSVKTLHMGDVQAMAILLAYVATLCGVALTLDHYDVSIKI
ncbi:Glucosaminyl phosphatidylinositol (GlcN-PI) nositol acylation protein [Elasticomyces elasticus]|uniref:GPI-anchored wall transfer protein n=1 Tax=Elasticomyces elasticus TaxID=574655 RepID=A0AAN7VU16_9PEZI|nr:Glucosaminyl phosphatidylinositol (GlcN-PI) nositol acylation protein [Elasticomyces elasticus]KAK3650182.1 Glucosaminyl phosphatidylinositol (GlcN-PI) nositol acylation protein [Elasticomyces elasticus]KAK4927043.1 Glucosaminyl phosphatidylinositol (GlcN-PI) nositol acylation protein [Elasticomyces elasticus]KAK5692950.1 Glucosaminyl phosphatidylinositol (GlcN-PI) nositol acylation protein [Elasticomyces elasticus]KAK5716081.1 Glucosaminyl phosphatidylinositol (GlcN-PI) nositol acylation pr